MAKNTGISYEKIVSEIFQSIHEQEKVENITVQHNVILQGKTTTHQIDVYWEFKVGTVLYKTVVQAKDWNNTVNQGELLKFASVLQDIPGQPRGVFITKTGYQKGAKDFANANDIILYELRKPTKADWEGKIKEITLHTTFNIPYYENLSIVPDKDWMTIEIQQLRLTAKDLSTKTIERSDQIIFTNEVGKRIFSFHELAQHYIKQDSSNKPECHKIKHIFDEPSFLVLANSKRLKIESLSFDLYYKTTTSSVTILGDNVVNFILKNVLEGSVQTIDYNMKLIGKRENY